MQQLKRVFCDTAMIEAQVVLQGPAVHALRAQTDKIEYAKEMRRILEETPNLFLREGMAVGLDLGPNDEVQGVKTFFGLSFKCRAAVVTTGTFMNGRIWVGRQSMPAGRCVAVNLHVQPAVKLASKL